MINVLLIEDSAVFVMGLTLLGILREAFPGVRTLVLSHYKKPAYILKAISAGACAYLAKDSSPESIVQAVADVAAGKCLFFGETIDAAKITRLFGSQENLAARKPQGLTPRELEVLQLTTSGYSNVQIASALEITVNTVESYKERIKAKFGLDSVVECVAHAVADGLVNA